MCRDDFGEVAGEGLAGFRLQFDFVSPLAKGMQRNPSHLGSYSHSPPDGDGLCELWLPLVQVSSARVSQIVFQFHSFGFREHRFEEIAFAFDTVCHVIDAEVFDGYALFDFFPRYRRGDGGARFWADRSRPRPACAPTRLVVIDEDVFGRTFGYFVFGGDDVGVAGFEVF